MINNFKDNPVAAAYVAMYEKQTAVNELEEAFKAGDAVTVKNANKYDSLAKATVSGTVIGMNKSEVMVKVGTGQMNVDPKDLVKESVDELEEATDLTKVSTDKLQAMWNSHKDEERPSPALAAQLKKISAELAQRKKSNMKERADWVPEEISDEGVADFMGAAADAAKKGDKTFKFGDKEYKVTMKKSTADAIGEGYSPQEIKQAIGIASDKRYAGGNMTGATSAIEKLKAGLSDHPQVKAVLKSKNEKVSEKDEGLYKESVTIATKVGK